MGLRVELKFPGVRARRFLFRNLGRRYHFGGGEKGSLKGSIKVFEKPTLLNDPGMLDGPPTNRPQVHILSQAPPHKDKSHSTLRTMPRRSYYLMSSSPVAWHPMAPPYQESHISIRSSPHT